MTSLLLGNNKDSCLFKNLFPFFNFINESDSLEFNKTKISDYCVITNPIIIEEGFNYIKYISDSIEKTNAKIYLIYMTIPINTITHFQDKNIVHLSLINNNKQTYSDDLIFVYGGNENICNEINVFFQKELKKDINFIITDSKTSELSSYIKALQESSNISIQNDFYNIAEEYDMDFNVLDHLLNKTQINISTLENITDLTRGYSNKNIKANLDYLVCLMNENNIHTFNIDGNVRSNIFNKRRSTKYFVEKNTEEKIFFYNVDEEFGFLSNFSDHPIFCKNKIWKTTEHYFQAQKFINTELEEKIRLSYTPSKAKDIAKLNKSKRLKNWDDIKDSVMYEALYAKFTQHPDLRLILLNTKEKELCEHCSNDFYWADGGNGSGKNILGKLLMKVRNKIKMVNN